MSQRFFLLVILLLIFNTASALTLKFKIQGDGDKSTYTLVALDPSGGEAITKRAGESGAVTLSGVVRNSRVVLLNDSNYENSVIFALKDNSKYKSIGNRTGCDNNDSAVMAVKRNVRSDTGQILSLKLNVGQRVYVKNSKQIANRNAFGGNQASAILDSSCNFSGVGSSSISSVPLITAKRRLKITAEDTDGDGLSDTTDNDDDSDGVDDAFDPDNDGDGIPDITDDNNDQTEFRVWNFQQLHLDIGDAYNSQVVSTTTEIIDNALSTYGGLAMQVIEGASVELNCGAAGSGLPYCTSGGTGRLREPFPSGLALPDDVDGDGDGKGTITAGNTGDAQIAPGANSSEIQPGDTFIQEVTDAESKITEYVGMINSVVHDVPGIVSIQTALGTTTFSWPTTATSPGSISNPIAVPSAGDVSVTITTYLPHYMTLSGVRVVPANIRMIANIPNGPCTYDSMTGQCSGSASGPGLLPGSLYSSPSTGWTVDGDGVQSDTATDTIEGEDSTVTYSMNLTGNGGITGWDSGEQVKVPIQSIDNDGTTAAINVWFKRQ